MERFKKSLPAFFCPYINSRRDTLSTEKPGENVAYTIKTTIPVELPQKSLKAVFLKRSTKSGLTSEPWFSFTTFYY